MTRFPAEEFLPPDGEFMLLLEDGVAVAGGAFLRHADPGTAEVKRMWTAASHRRRGLARRVLAELEQRAAARRLHPDVPHHRPAPARGAATCTSPPAGRRCSTPPCPAPPTRGAARPAGRPAPLRLREELLGDPHDHAGDPHRADRRAARRAPPTTSCGSCPPGTPAAGSPPPSSPSCWRWWSTAWSPTRGWEWDVVGAYFTEESIVRGVLDHHRADR